MITPAEYNSLLEASKADVRPKVEALLDEKIREYAGRLRGMPLFIVLVQYRPITEEEREEILLKGGRPSNSVCDWRLNIEETDIAVEILQDNGWYVKNDKASRRYNTSEVTINDVPFPEEDEPEGTDEARAMDIIDEFNGRPWLGRLTTTRLG